MTREYKRNGTVNLFAYFQPLNGWRHIEVTMAAYKTRFCKANAHI